MPTTTPSHLSTVSSSPQNSTSSIPTIVSGINCDTIEYVQRYSPIILTQVLQLFLAFLSVGLVISGRVAQHHSYFHPNVKSLLKAYHAALLMYAFAIGTAQRTIATQHLGRGYENRQGTIGKFFSWSIILISLTISLAYHYPDFSKNRVCTHCIYDQNQVLVPMELMVWLAGLATVSLGYTVVLWVFNRCKLKKKTYSLAIEFQINQNLRILQLILPLSLITCLSFLWYSICPQFLPVSDDIDPEKKQFHEMVQNIFPLYTLISSTLWLLMMISEKKKKRILMVLPDLRKDEKDVYFQSLNDQWSRVPKVSSSRLQILTVFSTPRSSMVPT
ncbi:Protein CBG21509 [Caenorhabditis briggsae]|uniref:Protein CBG21509 n=1 Tax=Caenorhabditis briggsae TaxID=6238 RepID=A8Y0A1_CAEBR|nr:Protein CBG21509 [Caenorhabditis briggsae]CAP38286.2 Protein CBG21509 [Caenorhabditis briggsae]